MASRLSEAGYRVVLAGRTEDRLKAATASLSGASIIQMDVTSEASVANAFEKLAASKKLPDILVNNAGAAITAPLEHTSTVAWEQMMGVNLTGAFFCSRAALPYMKEKGFGRIITVASTAGLKGYAYTSAYTAAKHGVVGLMRAMAQELAASGVTANAVCPGFTDTDIVKEAVTNIVSKTNRSSDDALRELIRNNPAKRLVSPDEVAATVLWLCSAEASAINGHALAVDCGETA